MNSIYEDQSSMSDHEQLLPVTKGDFIRLEKKFDFLASTVAALGTAVGILQARPEHKQPCDDFLRIEKDFTDWKKEHSPCQALIGHISEHKEIKSDWRSGFISFLFGIVSAALLAAFAYIFSTMNTH